MTIYTANLVRRQDRVNLSPQAWFDTSKLICMLRARSPSIRLNAKGQIYPSVLALLQMLLCDETRRLVDCDFRVDDTKPKKELKLPALQISWGEQSWHSIERLDERLIKTFLHNLGFGPFRIGRLRSAMALYAIDKQAGVVA